MAWMVSYSSTRASTSSRPKTSEGEAQPVGPGAGPRPGDQAGGVQGQRGGHGRRARRARSGDPGGAHSPPPDSHRSRRLTATAVPMNVAAATMLATEKTEAPARPWPEVQPPAQRTP